MKIIHNSELRVALTVRVFSALIMALILVSSCELIQKDRNEQPEVSVRNSRLGPDATQEMVSVKYSGDWTLWLISDNGPVDWARLSVTSGTGNRSSVILTCDKNEGLVSRTLKIVIDTGSRCAECAVLQLGRGDGTSNPNMYTLAADDLKSSGWLELPAMDNPNLGYYGHGFYMENKRFRNYSFGWSQSDRVSVWVAYPLCERYTRKTVNRKDEWDLDPNLGSLSSNPDGSYGGSYVRGHQLPSADRLCSREANRQTFYGTNITPQLSSHNSGIWETLEGKIRTIANKSDTTYVVTGVVLSPSGEKTTDASGQSMTVPTAYFKAVLRYSASSEYGNWNAAGFYLEHRSYTGGLKPDYSMSIDELEKKTGLDFFVNLPVVVGESKAASIEAADPANVLLWW